MKNRKYYIIAIIVVIIMAIYLHNNTNQKKLKIVLFNENTELLEKSIYDFSKKNNIKVEIEKQDFYKTMEMLEGKTKFDEEIPDIFMSASDWMGEIVNKKIAEKVNEDELKEIIPSIREAVKIKEKYYGYPYRIETLFLFCNKKYVSVFPKSVEELLKEKIKIEKTGKISGVIFPTDEIYYHYQWYKYFGGGVNGIVNLNNEDIAMKNEVDFINRNFKYLNKNSVIKKYNKEESAMMINGSWEIEKILNEKISTEYGMIKDENFKPFIGVKSFVISKKSKNKILAKKLIHFLSAEQQQLFSKEQWHISPNEKVFAVVQNRAVKELRWCIENPEMMPSNLSIRKNCNKAGELFSRVVKNKEDLTKSIKENFGGKE